jgi:hypothetical protein
MTRICRTCTETWEYCPKCFSLDVVSLAKDTPTLSIRAKIARDELIDKCIIPPRGWFHCEHCHGPEFQMGDGGTEAITCAACLLARGHGHEAVR